MISRSYDAYDDSCSYILPILEHLHLCGQMLMQYVIEDIITIIIKEVYMTENIVDLMYIDDTLPKSLNFVFFDTSTFVGPML